MVRNYNLSQRLLAYLLVLSLFLQSCGNVPNQIKPIRHQAESDSPRSSKQDDIQQLLEQDFTAEKGYIVTFYEDNGILKADVKVDAPQTPIYKGLPVTIEKGTKVAELHHLDLQTQQQRIQLQQPKNGQPGRVLILKGGLLGGMLEGDKNPNDNKEKEPDKTLPIQDTVSYYKLHFNIPILDIPKKEIPDKLTKIGEGSYGTVFKGRYRGEDVAIKFLNKTTSYNKEAMIMASNPHANIVALKGFCPEAKALIMEYVPGGNLEDLILICGENISLQERYKIALDIAEGMCYLHDRDVVHCDLKSANVLLDNLPDNEIQAKITDFGISGLKTEHDTFGASEGHTLCWVAPEILLTERNSKEGDVYSYGMILWQLWALKKPFENMEPKMIKDYIKAGNHEEISKNTPPEIKKIIELCWSPEQPPFVRKRPSMKDVRYSIDTCCRNFLNNQHIQQELPLENKQKEKDQSVVDHDIASKYVINTCYQYEDIDIQAILSSRINDLFDTSPEFSNKRIHILAAADNIMSGQLSQRLIQEKEGNHGERILLIPYNLGNFHWVGLLIEIDENEQVVRAEYLDSLNGPSNISRTLQEQLASIYPNFSFESRELLKQVDNTSCGAYTIENLLLAIKPSVKIAPMATYDIRYSHLKALKKYKSDFYDKFYIRQRDNKPTTAELHEQLKYLEGSKKIQFSKQEFARILAIKKCLARITDKKIKQELWAAFQEKKEYEDKHIIHLNAIRTALTQNVSKLSDTADKEVFQELVELLFGFIWEVGSSLAIKDTSFCLDYNLILAVTQSKLELEEITSVQEKLNNQIKDDEAFAIKLQEEWWNESFTKIGKQADEINKKDLAKGNLSMVEGAEKEKEAEKEKLDESDLEELLAYAQSDDREAQFKLGERSYETWRQHYNEEDLQEAKKWLAKAADQGHEVAIALLAEVNLPPLVEDSKAINYTRKGKEKESNPNTSPILTTKSTFNNQNQIYLPPIPNAVLQEDSQQQELKKRIIAQLAQPAYYQRIKLELHKHLLIPTLSQKQKEILSELIRMITAPEKKLRLGGSYEIREDFRANPSQEHNLFEPLRRDIQKLAGYKQGFSDTPIKPLLEELIEKHQAFISSLTEQVKSVGHHAPLKLFEAKPILQGEGFNCYEVEINKAYQLACYDLHEYEYVRSNSSGLSIGSMHGGIYFKVDNGSGLLRPAKEHAVYSLYQALGLAHLLSPTHLIIMNGLSILPPDIGDSPEQRELLQRKQELQTASTQEVFNSYPELEQKLKVAQKERSLFIQGSLVVPGKSLEKFLEETEANSNADLFIQELEPASFSGHVLASLLLLPTDYKPSNLMIDEQNRIIGIDNDAALESEELRQFTDSRKHGVNIKNIFYLLPLMQSAIAATIQQQFIKLHPALFLLNWLIGLQDKQPHYDYLLSASLIDSQNITHAERSLGLPLQFVPGWVTTMYERLMKIQSALKNNPSITHQELFEQIHPFASRYYKAVKKLFSHPLDQIAFIYGKTPKDFATPISNDFEDLITQYPESEDEPLLNNLAQFSFIKQDLNLSIRQAIQELIATIDLKNYSTLQQLAYIERVVAVGIWPDKLHESWYNPLLLIHMVAEGASNKVIKAIIDKGNADIHTRNGEGETVLHAAVRRGGQDALRQIPLLIKLGADKEAQADQTSVTSLDVAAEKGDINSFKLLIDLGAGEKAIHNKINDFYKQLSSRDKKTFVSHITKLTQINPKAGWKISLDEIFPIQGEKSKGVLKTVTEGDRIISKRAWSKIFGKDGKPKKTNAYGVRSVPFLEKYGQRIYLKFFPQLPGTELAVIRLAENLLGYCAPYCELASINGIPVLLTQGIPGETLYEVLTKRPEKLNLLDPESVSKALILAMLINPGDGHLGNYILSPFTNTEGQERYRLISIDNDQAFMPAIAKSIKTGLWGSTLSLQVKTILYCLDIINQPINSLVADKIKNTDLLKALESWLTSLKIHHEAARNHFESTLLKKYQEEKTTIIGVAFTPGMIKQLFTKLMHLQTTLNKKKPFQHVELLAILEPFVAHRYKTVMLDTHLNPIEKFEQVDNITGKLTLTSTSNALSQVLISKEIPDIHKLQAALWSGKYGPDQALKELQEVKEQHTNLEQILKDLGQLKVKTLHDAPAGITEQLLQEADLTSLSLTQQKALLDAIKGQELSYINLKNCSALTGSLLTSFNLDHIKKLDVSGCSNLRGISSGLFKGSPLIMPTLTHFKLNDSGVRSIRLQAEELKTISVRNCNKLKTIELIAPALHRLDLRGATKLTKQVICPLFDQFPNTFIYLMPTRTFSKHECANYLYKQGEEHFSKGNGKLAIHYLNQGVEQGNSGISFKLIKLALQGNTEAQSWIIKQIENRNESTQGTLDLSYNYIGAEIAIKLVEMLPNTQIHTLDLRGNLIGDEGTKELAEALPKSRILALDLSTNQIGAEGASKLAKALPKSQIHTLDLSENKIGRLGASTLAETLPNTCIHTLHLSSNEIDDSGAAKLAEALPKSHIHTLDLRWDQISAPGASKIAEALPKSQIYTLDLSYNYIGDEGAIKLAEALPKSQIHTLYLRYNQIGASGASKIAEALPKSQIYTLDLSYNQIGASGASKIAEVLPKSQIHTLYLTRNEIGASGASKIAEVLPNSQIHTLDLSRNKIGDSEASKLADTLPNTQIYTLDLSSNEIGDSGASKIAEVLPNTQIHTLNLNWNKIGDSGASKLSEALPNSQIHTLYLSGNKIGHKRASKIAEALPNSQIHTLNKIGDSETITIAEALPNSQIHTLNLGYNQIGASGASKIAEALANSQIHTLNLGYNQIGASGASKIAEALANSQIHTLDLSSNKIGDSGASKIAEALPSSQIHTLNLGYNKIGASGASKIAETLPNSRILALNLSYNQIGDSGASKIAETLPNSRILELNLSYNQIGDSGASKIAEALPNTQIHTLDLSNNRIEDAGVMKLSEALPKSQIYKLSLNENRIEDAGASKIAEALLNSQIHTLDLRWDQIGASGASKIAEALPNSQIHTLDLSSNQIGDSGASKIAEALPNSQIQTLDLSNNQIGDSGASKIAEALADSQIHTLDLSFNQIGASGASKIAEALANSQIHTLYLSGNQIGDSGAGLLAEALPNSYIHTLYLYNNEIGALGASLLAEALPNSQIHTLDLSWNQIGDSGASKIAEALSKSQIHTLDLSRNKIGNSGASKLAEVLPKSQIHTLNLEDNQIGDSGASKLAEALPKSQIHTLDLRSNQIGAEGASLLAESLLKSQIHTLNLAGNKISSEMKELLRQQNPKMDLVFIS